jgi:hypothetical protein
LPTPPLSAPISTTAGFVMTLSRSRYNTTGEACVGERVKSWRHHSRVVTLRASFGAKVANDGSAVCS